MAALRTERSPVTVGFLGILILLMITASAFYLTELPYIGATPTYTAEFTEAAGLQPGNEVRIAGVKVGTVTAVGLNSSHNRVAVKFRASDAWIGDQTSASIQVKTLLGQKFLQLEPAGSGLANPHTVITRTTSPYDVIEAFSDVAQTVQQVNTDQLAQSFSTLSDALSGTPQFVGPALDGVTRLSQTISSRDQELQKLLAATKDTSKILADRNHEFEQLIAGAGQLLSELNVQQKAISNLLDSTIKLSDDLNGIVADNQAQIGPTLQSLQGVTTLLKNQNENLRKSLNMAGPFYRLYSNVLGNGRWFDAAVTNILPPGLPQQNTTRPPVQSGILNNGGTEVTAP